jgi:hypothetical protein
MVSEISLPLKSQASQKDMSIDSEGNTIIARRFQGKMETEKKPRFVEFTCSHFEVLSREVSKQDVLTV